MREPVISPAVQAGARCRRGSICGVVSGRASHAIGDSHRLRAEVVPGSQTNLQNRFRTGEYPSDSVVVSIREIKEFPVSIQTQFPADYGSRRL